MVCQSSIVPFLNSKGPISFPLLLLWSTHTDVILVVASSLCLRSCHYPWVNLLWSPMEFLFPCLLKEFLFVDISSVSSVHWIIFLCCLYHFFYLLNFYFTYLFFPCTCAQDTGRTETLPLLDTPSITSFGHWVRNDCLWCSALSLKLFSVQTSRRKLALHSDYYFFLFLFNQRPTFVQICLRTLTDYVEEETQDGTIRMIPICFWHILTPLLSFYFFCFTYF